MGKSRKRKNVSGGANQVSGVPSGFFEYDDIPSREDDEGPRARRKADLMYIADCMGCGETTMLNWVCPCSEMVCCTRDCWLKTPHGINRWSACAAVRVVEKNGNKEPRRIMSRKDFEPGDILYRDYYPLIKGPSMALILPIMPSESNSSDDHNYASTTPNVRMNVCLTCDRPICVGGEMMARCGACGWIFCNEICAMDPIHSKGECVLFNIKEMPSFFAEYAEGSVSLHKMIFILRALLLKYSNKDLYNYIIKNYNRHVALEKYLLEELAKGKPDFGNSKNEDEGRMDQLAVYKLESMQVLEEVDTNCSVRRHLQDKKLRARKIMRDANEDLESVIKHSMRRDLREFWNIVRLLRWYNVSTMFRREEIIEMLAVLKANTTEYRSTGLGSSLWYKEGVCLLYELTSAGTRSCIPNATVKINPDEGYLLTCSAIDFIKPGSIIKMCLMQPVFLLFDTHARQQMLMTYFGVTCTCARCSDPTEKGTNLMRLNCSMIFNNTSDDDVRRRKICTEGLLPVDPLNPFSDWKCQGKSPCSDTVVPFVLLMDVLQSITECSMHVEHQRHSLIQDLNQFNISQSTQKSPSSAMFIKKYVEDYVSLTNNHAVLPALHPNNFLRGLLKVYGMLILSVSISMQSTIQKEFGRKAFPSIDIGERIRDSSLFVRDMYSNVLPPFSYIQGILYLFHVEGLSVIKNQDMRQVKSYEKDKPNIDSIASIAAAFVLLAALRDDSLEVKHMLRNLKS